MNDAALHRLYETSLSFRLYADHKLGSSLAELAQMSGKPVSWVTERVEAARLCFEKQVFFDFEPPVVNPASSSFAPIAA